MDEALRRRLVFHGAVTLFLGLAAGFPLALVILGDLGGEVRAWHLAHMEGVTNALLLWAVAGIGPVLRLGPRAQRGLVLALIITAYGNALASIFGAITEVRGLWPGQSAANTIAYVVYMAAIFGVFAAVAWIARGSAPRPEA